MIPFRLGLSELRRTLSGRMPRLAMAALAIIPSLYAGLYLFANFDPYGHLDRVPAAVVVQDEGATVDGTHTVYGDQVADKLTDGGGFGWVRTTQTDAERGVRSGRFDAAVVLGKGFSQDLTSTGRFEPQQASITLVTNDANNYLARTIADNIVGEVRDALAQQVGQQAADTFLRGFASVHTNLADAVDGARSVHSGASDLRDGAATLDTGAAKVAQGASTLSDGAARLADGGPQLVTGAQQVRSGAEDLADGAGTLSSGLGTLKTSTAHLPQQTRDLADGASQVADGTHQLAQAADQLTAATKGLADGLATTRAQLDQQLGALVTAGALTQADVDQVLAGLDGAGAQLTDGADALSTQIAQVDDLAAGARKVSDGAAALASSTPALTGGIDDAAAGAQRLAAGATTLHDGAGALVTGAQQASDGATSLADGAKSLDTGAAGVASGAHDLHTGAGTLVDGSAQLADGLQQGLGQVPDVSDADREATAQTIGNPVAVVSQELSKAGSYGAGLAPFFLSLATWIGAYVTFLIVRPLSRRALAAGANGLRAALGGLVTPAVLAVVQVAVMVGVTVLGVGVHAEHLALTFAFLVLVGIAFAAILQALNVVLGASGQFLGLVLMLTQLVTAGGTFPWQTIPEPLRTLHRFLPMSYSVDGLRKLLFGGDLASVWGDVAVVGGFLVAAVAVTAFAARRQRVWRATALEPELVL